jgi:hypothetical protein
MLQVGATGIEAAHSKEDEMMRAYRAHIREDESTRGFGGNTRRKEATKKM